MSRLKKLFWIRKLGLRQKDVAQACGVSESFVSQWFRNVKNSKKIENFVDSLISRRAA